MNLKILVMALLLSSCGAADNDNSAAPADSNTGSDQAVDAFMEAGRGVNVSRGRLDEVVREVMQEQYGNNVNAAHSCWETSMSIDGKAMNYCMKPGPAELVDTRGGKQLYLRAANVADISSPGYEYGQIDSGQMGAFNLRIEDDGSWTYLAAEKSMPFGTVGYCGCDAAKLVKLDSYGLHGWMFASGGVWQGIVATKHSIVAPLDGVFKDISNIPETPEDEQSVKYDIEVIESADGGGMFPLRVTRNESGKVPETFTVNFDSGRSGYSLPQGK